MTKQEKIKEAWGECWNKLPNEAQEKAFKNNGFVDQDYEDLLTIDKRERKLFEIRPKSLQGIENNNGWIKIESEEDLPKEKGEYWIVNTIYKKPIMQMRAYTDCVFSEKRNKKFWLKYVTHYQLIEKPELPIY